MSSKYVMANILMPIEVKPDGSIEPMTDYININITYCEKLPEKQNANNLSILEQINNAISTMTPESTDDAIIIKSSESNE